MGTAKRFSIGCILELALQAIWLALRFLVILAFGVNVSLMMSVR